MSFVRQLSIHEVKAENLKVEAINYNDSRWVSLKIADFELTMFVSTPEEYERLKNFFMVEDETDRAISEAQFRTMEENVKLVIIESPFAAKDAAAKEENIAYGRACVKDSLERGEAPFASHLFYPMVLDDNIPADRNLGMASGWAWMAKANLVAVYADRGISQGMQEGITQAKLLNIPVEYRTLESPK